MLLSAVLAGFVLVLAAENVAAKPPPGTEEKAALPTGDMKVFVKDEGTTGIHLKPYSSKKSGLAPAKKEQTGLKAAIKDEGATGAHLKEPTGNGVPPLKHISFANNDKPHKKEEKHDESPDFEDTPLVAAASSQTSRINVKKGPNGQEYEYEYVYYYYDDEDEEGKGGAKTDKPAVSKTERPGLQDEEPSPSPRQEAKSHHRQDVRDQDKEEDIRQISRQELRDEPKDVRNDDRKEELVHEGRQGSFRKEAKQDLRDEKRTDNFRQDTRDSFRQDYKDENRQDLRYEGRQSLRSEGRIRQGLDETRGGLEQRVEEPVRHRGGDNYEERRQEGRGRTRGQQQEARPEEERRRRPVEPVEDKAAPARSRYTTIERGRGKNSEITTVEPSSNEVLPTRSPSRGRQPVEAVEEERLPSNQRFPGRSRGSATTEPPPSRSRGSGSGGGSVRRPSLVDSSSFRTHSSDAAPEEDQGGYLSSAVGDTRESDLEEYIRPTTFQPQPIQTTLPPLQPSSAPSTLPEENDQEMPAKAALDLYAILQQTQEENAVVDSDYGTTNVPTTDPPTTTPEPTTTPTTTTTTTTTTTPPPPEPTKRGRFRSGGSRTRVRSKSSTTTTTEAAPEDEASQRPKFKPSHSRSPGQVSAYGRRRSSAGAAASSTTTEATQQSTRARNNFQSGGNRYRTRGRVSTTPAPVEEEEPSEEAESTSTTAKPRVRIGGSAGARPLRPGPRLNLRPNLRPGASTTSAPSPASPEAPVEQEVATTPEAPPHSDGDSLTKLRSRPRLKVQPVVPQTRPFNNQRRPLIGLNNRRRTTESEASAETTTQPTPVETETPPPSSTEPQPHTTENKLASLIGRRRPINRRLPIQPAGDH